MFMKQNQASYLEFNNILAGYLDKKMRVLEIGCGTGQLSCLIADNVAELIATDFLEKMIANAKKHNVSNNILFKVEDGTNLSFEDKSFDCVLIANVLHIVSDSDAVIKEIRRVLKDDGFIFAPIFVYNDNKFNIKIWFIELLGFKMYHKFTSDQYIKYLEKNELKIDYKKLIKGKPLSEFVVVARLI